MFIFCTIVGVPYALGLFAPDPDDDDLMRILGQGQKEVGYTIKWNQWSDSLFD